MLSKRFCTLTTVRGKTPSERQTKIFAIRFTIETIDKTNERRRFSTRKRSTSLEVTVQEQMVTIRSLQIQVIANDTRTI